MAVKSSIVIHTSSRRLECYEGTRLAGSYPIAIGKSQTPTPHGKYTIVSKHLNPGGVFGACWMGLSIYGYGIHGTNNPASIGTAASKGCIRMHNHDVENLSHAVNIGTSVIITS